MASSAVAPAATVDASAPTPAPTTATTTTTTTTTTTHQFSLPLPRSLDSRIYIHLTVRPKSVLLAVTTAAADSATTPTPLGSFVYALPDRFNPSAPLSTPLCTVEPTLDFATRLARLVAARARRPTYVASSVSLAGAALGGSADEEMAAFAAIVAAVVPLLS